MLHKCPYCNGGVQEDKPTKLTEPSVAATMVKKWSRKKREHFIVLYLDTRNQLIKAPYVVSIGSLNNAIVHPREVFIEGIKRKAASLIVTHNHPSGLTDPSAEDILITKRLDEAGKLLGIKLLDHIIHGRNGYTSLKAQGFLGTN